MSEESLSAAEITKRSKSNLAFALQCLPKERRDDLIIFYAFCRVIDDIADDEAAPTEQKASGLAHWKSGIDQGFSVPTPLQKDVQRIIEKYEIPPSLFIDLIVGCEMDLAPQNYNSWEDLQSYTYRVACVVGIISLYIFGADPQRAELYALKLGHALQLTNIIRDVGEDLDNGGRIYLPIEDFAAFDYSEADLRKKIYDQRFQKMMAFQADRAQKLYDEAHAALPIEDREALKAARIMGDIYSALLIKIQRNQFQVLHQRTSLSKLHKGYLLIKGLLR